MNLVLRLAVLWLVLARPAFAADLVFPPGSRIGLVPPEGFTVSRNVMGFEGKAGAILAITELAGESYARLAREFTPEGVRNSGLELLGREELALPGGPAVIVVARNQAGGTPTRQWALSALFGDIALIVMLTMPEEARATYPDATVQAMFRTVSVRPKLSQEDLLAVLPYRLDDLGGFHVMRVTPNGMAALTLGPSDTPLPVEQPYLLVVSHAQRPPAMAQQNFARGAFAQVAGPATRVVSEEAIRIGGEPGYQIVGENKDRRTGDELKMVMWLRFGLWGTMQMTGFARKDRWDAVFAQMRAVRDGFAMK
jgi:hypothetical protein